MGRLVNGINGPIVGKVGTVIGSSRNGKPYLKGPYKPRTKKVSKAELGNRSKFSQAQFWLKPLLKFVREGYRSYKMTSGAFVAAKAYLLRNAFEGMTPDMHINPALMKVSVGKLPLSNDLAVEKKADGTLLFTWSTEDVPDASRYDQVMMLAYNIEEPRTASVTTGQLRRTGSDTLSLHPIKGDTWHIYMAFNSFDRTTQSDSVYMGTISY